MLTGISDTACAPCLTVEEPTAMHTALKAVHSAPRKQHLEWDAPCDESQQRLELPRVTCSLPEPTGAIAAMAHPAVHGDRTCVVD